MTDEDNGGNNQEITIAAPREIYADPKITKVGETAGVTAVYSRDPYNTIINVCKNRSFYRDKIFGVPKAIDEYNLDMSAMVGDVGNTGLLNMITDAPFIAEILGYFSQRRLYNKPGTEASYAITYTNEILNLVDYKLQHLKAAAEKEGFKGIGVDYLPEITEPEVATA